MLRPFVVGCSGTLSAAVSRQWAKDQEARISPSLHFRPCFDACMSAQGQLRVVALPLAQLTVLVSQAVELQLHKYNTVFC